MSEFHSKAVCLCLKPLFFISREALEFVQNRRYCINPNDGFKQQLIEYEAIYKAQQTLLNGQCSQEKGKLKRKHDQTFDDFDQDSSEPMESLS